MLLADASNLLGKAVTSIRDVCIQKAYPIYACDKRSVLLALKELEVIKSNAASTALIRLTDLIKLASDMKGPEVLKESLKHLFATSMEPPPQRHNISRNAAQAKSSSQLDKYSSYVFPSTLPVSNLLPEERTAKYSMVDAPKSITRDIQEFMKWSALPINLERSDKYASGVQSTTLEKVPLKILGFLGYIGKKYAISYMDISISMYDNPKYCVDFISYLIARDVGLGHLRCVFSFACQYLYI